MVQVIDKLKFQVKIDDFSAMRAGLWVGILCIVWGLLPLQTIVAQGNKKAKVKIVNADSLLVGTLGKPSRFIVTYI